MNYLSEQQKKVRNYKAIFLALLLLIVSAITIVYASQKPYLANEKRQGKVAAPVIIPFEKDLTSKSGLSIKSIDTQIVSKNWKNVSKRNIKNQISMIKGLGINYVAVSTPYDAPKDLALWADEIHRAGLNVWFRSHWLNWEGDEGTKSDLTFADNLTKTKEFITSNPNLFEEGDAFTLCIEPEQMYAKRGIDKPDWAEYNMFVLDQVQISNQAFLSIGKPNIHTNWISTNGWILMNVLEKKTVETLGVITVDHYPDANLAQTPETLAQNIVNDLDGFHKKWNKPIILGEFGFSTAKEASDSEQQLVLKETLSRLKEMPYIVGLNYWAHMGNSSRIISDVRGSSLRYRPAAYVLKEYYRTN